ncbi:unnamed protein product, partial [Mesorhabditis belari]|uniref:Uncharacterized protein n=1 Tax=Mesorhabditis belari TaxID=2138241 RepID=A0AAF3FA68_9BILA
MTTKIFQGQVMITKKKRKKLRIDAVVSLISIYWRFCEPIRLLCLIWSILLLITGALTCIMLCQKVWGNHHPKAFLSEVLSPNLTLIIMEGESTGQSFVLELQRT